MAKMQKTTKRVLILATILLLIFILKPFYFVQEGEQVVLVRLGRLVNVEREAGLKFKMPVIDSPVRYPKKILSWDGNPQKTPTKQQKFILVDTTARWVISDPETFYGTVQDESQGVSRLNDAIETAVRDVIALYNIEEAIRTTNDIHTFIDQERAEIGGETVNDPSSIPIPDISSGRLELSDQMLERAQERLEKGNYGIELIDLVIRQIQYTEDLTESVHQRMIAERDRVATYYRSEGAKEKQIIVSQAKKEAEQIRAKADAEASQIYANAYSKDPAFYRFWKSMESYRKTVPEMNKVLSTDMGYFDFLYGPNGR